MVNSPLEDLIRRIEQRDRPNDINQHNPKFDLEEHLRKRLAIDGSNSRNAEPRVANKPQLGEEHQESTREYFKVQWEILPPGEYPFDRIKAHFKKLQKNGVGRQIELDRLKTIEKFNPEEIYIGKIEFEGYIVFNFKRKGIAILDCPYFGNAIYVVKGDWRKISRLSKSEVLDHYPNCDRIIHRGDWKERLSRFL